MARGHRRGRHPVPHPQRQQGAGGARDTRAQADRVLYKAAIRRRLEKPNLTLFQQAVDDLTGRGGRPRHRRRHQIGLRFERRAWC
jgi:tRNA U34 5-carboxymethylaminomethyl modifying enzyme MnmG/GidA